MNILKMGYNSIQARITSKVKYFSEKTWLYRKGYYFNIIENTYFFESFGGNFFVGDPYYIFQYLFYSSEETESIFYISAKEIKEIQTFLELRGEYDRRVQILEKDSAAYIKALCRSEYLINNMSLSINFIKKTNQYYLQIPHGKVYKNATLKDDPFGIMNPQRMYLLCDSIMIPNELSKDDVYQCGLHEEDVEGKIRRKGFPRNAVLMDIKAKERIIQQIHKDKAIILYMPTWRNSLNDDGTSKSVSVGESLAGKLQGEYDVYLKLHQAEMRTHVGSFKYAKQIPDGLEPYEMLAVADILITDYSSVFLDYINTNGQVILYQYDRKEYDIGRGVRSEIEKILPYPIVEDEESLIQEICTGKKVNDEKFKEMECVYDSPHSIKDAVTLLHAKDGKQKQSNMVLYLVGKNDTDEDLRSIQTLIGKEKLYMCFVLGQLNVRYEYVNCLDEYKFLPIYKEDRLSLFEKISGMLCVSKGCHIVPKYLKKVSLYAAEREQRRMWGNNKVDTIYIKQGTHVPLRLRMLNIPIKCLKVGASKKSL